MTAMDMITTTETGADPPRPRLSILYEIHAAASAAHELVEQTLAPHGISGSEFALLSLLAASGAQPPSRLAEWSATSPPTVSKLLARLESRDLVERRPNPADGRSTLVELTGAGRDLHARARPDFAALSERLAGELGSARDDVRWSLQRLAGALSTLAGRPADQLPGPRGRTLAFEGPGLTVEEEADVRDYIAWVVWRRSPGATHRT
jgi:DNA-binding MarR family transcriptional regulator